MAGGKETPRQKMIGMMYLVLTALLALQIKDTVLEKFVLIENGLEVSNSAFIDYNQQTLESIQKDVANQGDKDGDKAVQLAAQNIRAITLEIINKLEDIKLEVGKASTGGDTSKIYERSTLKKYEEPSNYLVNKGNAEALKKLLDEYPQRVNAQVSYLEKGSMNPEWMQSIAIDANDIKFYENNAEAKGEDYAHFNFYKAPLASVLAQLTFYKNQLLSKEAVALNKLRGLVGTAVSVSSAGVPDAGAVLAATTPSQEPIEETPNDNVSNTPTTRPSSGGGAASTEIKEDEYLDRQFAGIDYAQATVLSESNLVTAGLDFNAQAFLTLGNSSLEPEIRLNGNPIEVVNGRGIVNFKTSAQPSEYDANGIATKYFDVEIVAKDGTGSSITRTTRHEYLVAQPVIDVRSQSVEILYLGCQNNLTLNVPALGPAYQPTFRVTGGTHTTGSQKGQISVVPDQREVKIDVSSSGQYIGFREFQARNVPLPKLDVRPNGQAYNANNGLDDRPVSLDLILLSDADFAERFPEDANFFVSKGSVLLSRGTTRKRELRIESLTPSIDLSSIRSQMQSGDRIVVSVEEIVRVNYKGEQVPIAFTGDVTMNIN